MAEHTLRSSIVRGLVAVTLAVTATGLLAGPASAHAALISTDPADGATLSAPPANVTFTFDEALLADTETISINDENGNVVASQQVTPNGAAVSVPWPADLSAGTFQVAYRVVSGDGHPVTGAITFTVTGGGSTTPSASATAAASSVPASTQAQASASATAAPADSGSSGVAVTVVILGAVLVLVLIVIVAVRMMRKRS
ncbi:MAG: copper resistance CopC family protein [Actinomycetes bacterium]